MRRLTLHRFLVSGAVCLCAMSAMPVLTTAQEIKEVSTEAQPSEVPLLPSVPQASQSVPTIAVIRTDGWDELEPTLTGVNHVTIPLDELSAEKLSDSQVILLPNAEELSLDQVKTLQAWTEKGGRLIVTGAVGSKSDPEVQASLRSLLGGYWEAKVEEPTRLLLKTSEEYGWEGVTANLNETSVSEAGILKRSDSESRAIAFWTGNTPAILHKGNVLFLGWQWGANGERRAFDRSWLVAAAKAKLQPEVIANAPAVTPTIASTPTQPAHTETAKQPQSSAEALRLGGTVQSASAALTSPHTGSGDALPKLVLPNIPPAPPSPVIPPPAETRKLDSPSSSTPSTARAMPEPIRQSESHAGSNSNRDSNDQLGKTNNPSNVANVSRPSVPLLLPRRPVPVAPPTPSVLPTFSNQPIHTLEAIAMRQELQDLIGRVEGAMTSAKVAQGQALGTSSAQQRAIDNAKRLLKDLPQLIAAQRYAEARTQWELVRRSLWKDYPTDLLVAMPEVRAMWLDRGTIVSSGSEQNLARVFDRMAEAGVNTVFFETVNAGYPIYPSRIAPQQNPLTRGWDPLAVAIKLAHQRNMELHAWVWVFSVGNQRHNIVIGKPENYVGPVLEAYPQWANLQQDGNVFAPEGKTFLDPSNPEVQNYLLRLYREIVSQYSVDGLHLDYIRYPRQDPGHNFGFTKIARAQFIEMTGVDPVQLTPDDRSLWWMWTEFRAQQVDRFVSRVATEMRKVKPKLTISAAVFPWRHSERLYRMQQNWERWVARGEIDMLTPMTYVENTNRFIRQEVKPLLGAVENSPVLFLPGVYIRNLPDIELLDQLQAVRDLPSSGYSLFAAEHLRPSFEQILRHARATQGAQILPHRRPFEAAQARYMALQQEWQALLKSDRLWVKGESLTSWQQQAETLDRALSALVQQPTQSHLRSAMSAVDTMSKNLPKWMKLESIEQPYRVSTWVNRLDAIQAILRYGEPRLVPSNGELVGKQSN